MTFFFFFFFFFLSGVEGEEQALCRTLAPTKIWHSQHVPDSLLVVFSMI